MKISFDRYIEMGSGPAVIFNHGTLMDATMFNPQVEYLAKQGYRAISANSRTLLGAATPHTLEDLADDTLELMDDLGLDKIVVAGLSVGAFSAIEFALKYQDRCSAVILIDGMAEAYPPNEQAAYKEKFEELNIDGLVPRNFAEWAAPFIFGETTFSNNMELVQYWIDRWATVIPSRSVWSQSTAWTQKADRTSKLYEINIPVLIIQGSEDVAIPIERVMSMLPEIPDVVLHKIHGAGHTSNLECPELINKAIADFLVRVYSD